MQFARNDAETSVEIGMNNIGELTFTVSSISEILSGISLSSLKKLYFSATPLFELL